MLSLESALWGLELGMDRIEKLSIIDKVRVNININSTLFYYKDN